VRVLNLWQKNAVFQSEVIQPLFDLADPNNPIHKEAAAANSNGNVAGAKSSPSVRTPTKADATQVSWSAVQVSVRMEPGIKKWHAYCFEGIKNVKSYVLAFFVAYSLFN
jgi:hypothetical protein